MDNEIKVVGKVTIQTMDMEMPISNTTVYEIEDVPLNDTELRNLIGFLLEAKQSSLEPEVKDEIIMPEDK